MSVYNTYYCEECETYYNVADDAVFDYKCIHCGAVIKKEIVESYKRFVKETNTKL